MYRFLIVGVVLVLMLVVGVTALRERSLPPAEFRYAIGDSIKTLDPARMTWNEDIRMALGLWEGLTSYDPVTTEPVEGAAYLPPQVSEDGLTYTFELRADARWSNGDAVKASDFVYGWRRAMEPGSAGDYAFLIADNIAGAGTYSRWRNEAVRVLGILRNLSKGQGVPRQERAYLESLNLPGVREENPDWDKMAQRFREEHLQQMELEFSKVGLEVLDDHHLRVKLSRPMAYFLDLTAFSTYLPIHQESVEKLRVRDDPAVRDLTLWVYDPQWVKPDYHRHGYPGLVTNGAFRLADWQFKRYMLLEKNPYYWDRANVRTKSIMARIISEPSTAFLAYEAGEVDWLDDVSRQDFAPVLVEEAKRGKRTDIHVTAAFGTYFYDFNCQDRLADGSVNPFADPQVRMAFSLAVDKQAIVDKVRKTGNPVARNFIPPGSIAGYECPPGPGYDPIRARELLAQAGYANGEGLPTTEILYNTGYDHDKPAQAIAEMWRANLGVNVTIRGKEVKTFDEDRKQHRFMVCRASWYGDYGDPTTFLDMMVTDNGNNDAGFSHADYDRLMEQTRSCRDAQRRMRILAQAERLLVQEQVPILPLYYYVNILAFREEVKGIYPNARNMYPFKYIRLSVDRIDGSSALPGVCRAGVFSAGNRGRSGWSTAVAELLSKSR